MGRVEFNGDMDEYRAAVNANMSCGPASDEDTIKKLMYDNGDLSRDNAKLKNELDTARKAMAKQYGKSAEREVELENRIKELETQLSNERLIRKENNYDVPMKGITL